MISEMDRRDYVKWCYRLLLEREPESDAVVDQHVGFPSLNSMVGNFLLSKEFQARHPMLAGHLVDRWAMIECRLGFNLWVNLADAGVSWPLIDEQFEDAEIEFVQRHVSAGMRTLDLGTNIGFYSMLMAKLVGPEGSVIGFEPVPSIHRYAVMSARANGYTQCAIHNVALSDREGTAFLVDPLVPANQGSAYIASTSEDGRAGTEVATRLLPTLAPEKVDFIKIDVEGAEYLALKPFLDNLRTYKPVIMSELAPEFLLRVSNVHVRDYVSMIVALGYDCVDINTGSRFADDMDGSAIANVAFLPH